MEKRFSLMLLAIFSGCLKQRQYYLKQSSQTGRKLPLLVGELVAAPRSGPAQGAIMTICSDNFFSEELKPVLQVLNLKLVQSHQHSPTDRYCLMLSDSSHYQQGVLATQKNELVNSGRLQKGSVVKLTHFICNVVQNRK